VRLRLTLAIIALLVARAARAERLPVESFTLAQGLASNAIHKIVHDSRGFLWICTNEGLSRFDGHQFVNFGVAQGMPGRDVQDFMESRTGDYWAAVNGGLVRIQGNGGFGSRVFYPGESAKSRNVHAVKETVDGTVWIGAEDGLYRMAPNSTTISRVDFGASEEFWSSSAIWTLEEDSSGHLWFGGPGAGIGRITQSAHVDRWTPREGFASHIVVTLHRDKDGSIWAGTEKGLCHMRASPAPGAHGVERCYGLQDGLPSLYTQSVYRSSDGELWIGTLEGAAFAKAGDGILHFSAVTRRQGLIDDNIEAVGEDIEGNIWLGAADDGLMRLSNDRLLLFTEADGLADPNVIGFVEDRQNVLYAVSRSPSGVALNRFDGTRFQTLRLNIPSGITAFGRGFEQVALQDYEGGWWIATGEGLLHYVSAGPLTLLQKPDVFLLPTLPDGGNVFRLFEDTQGDIWWSTSGRILNQLARWDRKDGKVRIFSDRDGLPVMANLPTGFVEDKFGALWLGFETQGLARITKESSRFQYFDPKTTWPIGRLRASYRDKQGRLWFGSSTGLWKLDHPEANKPDLQQYDVARGLSSDTIHSLTGDSRDRIYIGTGKGLDRLDPESGRISHVLNDGFPTGIIQAAYVDKAGNLWFGSRHGAARFVPEDESRQTMASRVRITALKVRGLERPVSAAGEAMMNGLEFRSNEDQIEFGFAAPNFRIGNEPSYEYRLEGAKSQDWTALSSARSVNFASLAPGGYRFLVRTANSGRGTVSPDPATVSFRILPPFWMTWWFRTVALLAFAAIGYAVYRYRLNTILERERLRFRIATDLHDDIGSSLSTIAIWSDVAVQQAQGNDGRFTQPLEQIGSLSREVIDSVSDIVWAINPQHDRFLDLVSRMRRHVDDLEGVVSFPISFVFEGDERNAGAGPVFRREVFLVLKEALNNVVRHSGCTECSVLLSLNSDRITLRISDNGCGFDPDQYSDGNGLESLRRRAERLGGSLEIRSARLQGTVIEMSAPISTAGKRNWKRYLRV